jgi:hypothetical protein
MKSLTSENKCKMLILYEDEYLFLLTAGNNEIKSSGSNGKLTIFFLKFEGTVCGSK